SIQELQSFKWSVTHRVDDIVDTEARRTRAVLQWLIALVQIFPEIADIVVVIRDQLQLAMLVGQSPKLWEKVSVRRRHVQSVDIEKGVKEGMRQIQRGKFALRNSPLQVVAEILHPVRSPQVGARRKDDRHNEAASPDIFTEIRDLFLIEKHEA